MKRNLLLCNIFLISLASCTKTKNNNEEIKSNITIEECLDIFNSSFLANNCSLINEDNSYVIQFDHTSPIADLYSNTHGRRNYLKTSDVASISYDDNVKEIENSMQSSIYEEDFYYSIDNDVITNTITKIASATSGINFTSNVWNIYDDNSKKNILIIDSPYEKSLNDSSYDFSKYPYQAKYNLLEDLSPIISNFLYSNSNLVSNYEFEVDSNNIYSPKVESGNKNVTINSKVENGNTILTSTVDYTNYICTHTSLYQDIYEEKVTLTYNINQTISFTFSNNKIISIYVDSYHTLDAIYIIEELNLHQHIYSTTSDHFAYIYSDDITNMNSTPTNLDAYIDKRK